MGGQQYVKGMVSMIGTPMVSTTSHHPDGYSQDDGNHEVWWGTSLEGAGYSLFPAWTAEDGHRLLVQVADGLTGSEAAAMAAEMARWSDQVKQ